jgi:hypothetical protein
MTIRGNDTVGFPQMRNENVSNILEAEAPRRQLIALRAPGFIVAWPGAAT